MDKKLSIKTLTISTRKTIDQVIDEIMKQDTHTTESKTFYEFMELIQDIYN